MFERNPDQTSKTEQRPGAEVALVDAPQDLAKFIPPSFDVNLPLPVRLNAFQELVDTIAERYMNRWEQDPRYSNSLPWLPAEEDPPALLAEKNENRKQQVERIALRMHVDLAQLANMAQLSWAMENEGKKFLDEDGNESTLLREIKEQMPDNADRAKSGRARGIWGFLGAAEVLRQAGYEDKEISRCNATGKSSVLGIVSATVREINEAPLEPETKHALYAKVLEEAEAPQSIADLEDAMTRLLHPEVEPPPKISYGLLCLTAEMHKFAKRPVPGPSELPVYAVMLMQYKQLRPFLLSNNDALLFADTTLDTLGDWANVVESMQNP